MALSHANVRMSTAHDVRPSTIYSGLAVTTSAALTAGLGFAALAAANRGLLPVVLIPTSAVGVGLTAGFISRWSLLYRGHALRWLVAVFGLFVGLVLLGWVSAGELGLDLSGLPRPHTDWTSLGQIGLGAWAAWMAVWAWSRPRERAAPRADVHPLETIGRVRRVRVPSQRRAARPLVQIGVRPAPPARTRRTRRASRRSSIRLASAVDYLCPYCLSPVDPNDDRGVVTCPICHTPHHADCWAVTGSCQVPHHQA